MKFNSPVSESLKTENLAGGEAFIESPKLEFVSILLTSFVKDQFYRGENETVEKITELLSKIDKKFAAKAAVFARTKYGMRSVSHLVAADIAQMVKGDAWTKNFFDKVVFRPDDITEILAAWYGKYSGEGGGGNKKLPNALKKGLAKAFGKFEEYHLAKYRAEGAKISLLDAVNLVHPKPNAKNKEALKKLMAGELKSTQTWESKLTDAGQKAETEEEKEELKKDVWVSLIKEKKMPYFALLRNLRNILEQAPEILPEALAILTDERLIKNSLVLPFRFLTAIKEIENVNLDGSREVLKALNTAIDLSLNNIPKFDGKTLVVLDTSGSMEGKPLEIGSLFSAALYKATNADLMIFSDDAKYLNLNPADSTLTVANRIIELAAPSGTNFHAIFEEANRAYDRIIILSDMQGWMGYDTPTSSFASYKSRVGGDPKVYSFDLAGYGTLQFPERNVFCLAGFSDKVFDIMKMLETDRQALINEIEKIEL